MNHNQKLYLELITLDLASDQYALTSNGPLGIRELRQINDIDIIVSNELWAKLSVTHHIATENKVIKIHLTDNIEATYKGSFEERDISEPSIAEQIVTSVTIQ